MWCDHNGIGCYCCWQRRCCKLTFFFSMCVTMAHIDMVNVQHFHIETSHYTPVVTCTQCTLTANIEDIGIFSICDKINSKASEIRQKKEIKSLCKVPKKKPMDGYSGIREPEFRIFYTYGIPNSNSFSKCNSNVFFIVFFPALFFRHHHLGPDFWGFLSVFK